MPELPEVETVRRGLARLIIGKQIQSVNFDLSLNLAQNHLVVVKQNNTKNKRKINLNLNQKLFLQSPKNYSVATSKSFPNSSTDVGEFLIGSKIVSVRRRAKLLMIDLCSGYSLLIHLKMTGQLVYVGNNKNNKKKSQALEPNKNLSDIHFGAGHPNDSLIGRLPDKTTRVEITFSDSSHLYFNDQRRFGWMRLIPTIQIELLDFFKKVGPEPLDPSFKFQLFNKRLQRRKSSTIKTALLDQTTLAGLGNIYVDESLWAAKIHPISKVADISVSKIKKLHSEIILVLNLAIDKGGSTSKNYVNAEGKKGSYMDFARVYRRENQPCLRCSSIIIKIRVASRGTHFCPKCQKISS